MTTVAEGFKVSAISSVVTGKKIEAEILSLQNGLGDIERDWPRLRTLNKEFLKREKGLKEKVLVDVKKKVKQGERLTKAATENAMAANNTAKLAEASAATVAKEAKVSFTRGKRTKHASAQLSSGLDVTLEQLTELESQAAGKLKAVLAEEDLLSSESVLGSMETAKGQLESFTEILAELLQKLEDKVALQNFDNILNATAARLHVLKDAVESPALTGKIHKLHNAAHSQEKQLQSLEENLREIREERDSLTDIVQNLPKCPQSRH